MTGGIPETFALEQASTQKAIQSGALWSKLLQYQEACYLMGAGTPSGSDRDISPLGLAMGHAYAILKVQEECGHKLLRMRNPWGFGEWTGDWSDKWPGWTEQLRAKFRLLDQDDGSFFISFEDFCLNFANIYVCKLISPSWHKQVVQNEWRGPTAGGAPGPANAFSTNPQYLLDVRTPAQLCVRLSQADRRAGGEQLLQIGFHILRKDGKRAKTVTKSSLVVNTPTYLRGREIVVEAKLEPGRYTVVPTAWARGDETEYKLYVYTDVPEAEAQLSLLDPATTPIA
eukprot:GAFH01002385.1.p2 GENE.GAFH01002385.1~~GAFH01002385.1.p2  ORF type:complete len:319 (+),score=143.82 GAFH01002385.1:105-959(+)